MSQSAFGRSCCTALIIILLPLLLLTRTGFAAPDTQKSDSASSYIPGSLQAHLDSMKQSFTERAPADKIRIFEDGVEQVAKSGVLSTALAVGDSAVDFDLPGATGKVVSLAALRKQGPVVLVWYRGGWCPYCNAQLQAMREVLPEIEKMGATMLAISPETPDNSLTTAEKHDLKFEVVSDAGNKVARQYGIVYKLPDAVADAFKGRIDLAAYNGDNSNELPLAVTYIVGNDGIIKYAFVDADYRKRAEPSEILAALRKLQQD